MKTKEASAAGAIIIAISGSVLVGVIAGIMMGVSTVVYRLIVGG